MTTASFDINDIEDLPPGLGGARPVELPATRYRQGGRTQYHVAIPVAALTRLLVNRPDPNRPLEGNRKVDANRARKFGEYLLKNDDWVAPAVIVRVPAHELSFVAKKTFDDSTSWGVLSIPLDTLTELTLLDGQHRTLGIFLALEMINDRIAGLRQTLDRLSEEVGMETTIREQQARLRRDLEIRKRLSDEHISIDVAEVSSDKAKQMFGDINNNAKGVNPDFTTTLDQRDVVNRIAIRVIENHPLLEDRVETGQSTRMSPANVNLVGAKGVSDIVRAVLVGGGRVGVRVEDEISNRMGESVKEVELFLDTLLGAFDDLNDVREGRIDSRELREKTMLGSISMLRVLAITYHDLKDGDSDSHQRPWSRAEIEDYFRKLAPDLARIPIAEDDKFWMNTKVFLPGASAPQARQGMFKALAKELVNWAYNGFPPGKAA